MQLIEISLGVHCNYCHDNDGAKRELDTKPQKAIARRMITMTQDINRTMFNGTNRVTCFTCHQGHTKPGAVVPYNDQLTREETMMPIAAVLALNTGTMAPTADQLINNAVNAIGGAMNLSRASGRVMKGSVTNLAHLDEVHTERAVTSVTPFDIYVKGNNRMTVQHNINGDAVTTYAGASGWTRAANADALAMRADVREANRLEQAVLNPADFKAFLTNLRVTGQEKVALPRSRFRTAPQRRLAAAVVLLLPPVPNRLRRLQDRWRRAVPHEVDQQRTTRDHPGLQHGLRGRGQHD